MKVLFTPITSSSVAHIVRSFAIAEKLEKRGDEVYFTSCTDRKNFIENKGYKVVKTYPPFNLNDPNDQSINYLDTNKDKLISWFKAEIDAAREVKPDVMVLSSGLFGPPANYATGIPTIALLNGQYAPSSKGLLGVSMADDSVRSQILRTILRPIFTKKFVENYLSHINDAYRSLGVRSDFTGLEDLYSGMDILIPGDEEFEPQFSDSNCQFVGPIFWEGFERNNELTDDFLKKFKGGDKLVFLNFGGSVFDKTAYDQIINEFRNIKAKKIVALGLNFKRALFPADREDLLIRNFVPGLRVSKYSDLVVNTGSQGAIMQALTYGVPVVAFSVGIDQAYFSNRLEELGLGVNVNKVSLFGSSKRESYTITGSDVPMRIISEIDKILNNGIYRKNTIEYAKRLKNRNYGGVDDVIAYADKLVN